MREGRQAGCRMGRFSVIGNWILEFIWNLVIGNWNFRLGVFAVLW